MIKAHTPYDQVVKELKEDYPRAQYWFKKNFHGEKGYDRMRDDLADRCALSRETKMSEVVEYISPNGNRWRIYENAQWFPSIRKAYTKMMTFCYYETLGSCGAYVIAKNQWDAGRGQIFILHFTDHFFFRFCDRLGLQMRSSTMVQSFCNVIPGFLVGAIGEDEKGFMRCAVRFAGSIGFGTFIEGQPMAEIRTYLRDIELNNKQIRETKKLREAFVNQDFEPYIVKMERIIKSDDFNEDMTREIENVAELSGTDRDTMMFLTNIDMFIVMAMLDLQYAKPTDREFWTRLGNAIADDVRTLETWCGDYLEGGHDEKEMTQRLYDFIAALGKRARIRGFDAQAVLNGVLKHWTEAADKMNSKGEDNDD